MNAALMTAAILTLGTGLAHSYLGERYILVRLLRRSDLPRLFGSDTFTRRVLRLAWHLTSIAWFGFAALLAMAADTPWPPSIARPVGAAIALTFLATAALLLLGSRGRHLAWLMFLIIAAATWYGMR